MDVTSLHDDIVERRNMMHDAKHHARHNGKSEKEADRSDKQPAPRTLGNVLAQKRAKTSAAENKKQCRHRRQKNWQKNPVAVHDSLDRDRDAAVILRKRSLRYAKGSRRRTHTFPEDGCAEAVWCFCNPAPCRSEARSIGEESACCRQRSNQFLARHCRAAE